jgi:FkbM family methyltransferase
MPPQFHFYPYAIGSNDKLMQMYPRLKKGKRSKIMMTMIDEGAGCENTGVTVKVKRIPTIVRELGFQKIDILKMDIEGAEYEVIDDTLDSGIPVYQIILEFHHRFRTLSVEMTKSALLKLNAAGYRIFHISDKCREYSLIHETMLRQYSPERNLPQTS